MDALQDPLQESAGPSGGPVPLVWGWAGEWGGARGQPEALGKLCHTPAALAHVPAPASARLRFPCVLLARPSLRRSLRALLCPSPLCSRTLCHQPPKGPRTGRPGTQKGAGHPGWREGQSPQAGVAWVHAWACGGCSVCAHAGRGWAGRGREWRHPEARPGWVPGLRCPLRGPAGHTCSAQGLGTWPEMAPGS